MTRVRDGLQDRSLFADGAVLASSHAALTAAGYVGTGKPDAAGKASYTKGSLANRDNLMIHTGNRWTHQTRSDSGKAIAVTGRGETSMLEQVGALGTATGDAAGTTSTIVSVIDADGRVYARDVTEITSLVSKRTVTPEGFIKVPATLARTGVQTYLARELGLDRAPYKYASDRQVNLYRPAAEVFAPDSMSSFENQTVAIDHPGKPVTADNWKDHAVGEVRDIARVGDTMSSQLLVKDKSGIQALNNGKKYLSNGYDFLLDMTPGTTPAGDSYDGVQRSIRGNHVALVDNPRGGPTCKVADSSKGEVQLMKIIAVDGIPVNVDDQGIAVIEKFIAAHTALQTKAAGVIKVGDASINVLDPALPAIVEGLVKAKDAALAQVVTPEQFEQRLAARAQLVTDAATLLPNLDVKGKDNAGIQREVIAALTASDSVAKATADAILAGTALDKATPEQLATTFKVLKATGVRTSGNDASISAAFLSTSDSTSASAATVGDSKVSVMLGRAAFIERTLTGTTKK